MQLKLCVQEAKAVLVLIYSYGMTQSVQCVHRMLSISSEQRWAVHRGGVLERASACQPLLTAIGLNALQSMGCLSCLKSAAS